MSTLTPEYRHVPVLLHEVLEALDPKPGELVCDCTLGGAGHTLALAKRVAPHGLSIGIDQDATAIQAAEKRLAEEYPEAHWCFLQGNFGNIDDLLVSAGVAEVDCFLFDLGTSSPQLDVAERGFSYREEAPLDMRMDLGNQTINAAEVIQTYNIADLTRILRMYGGERHAHQIASAIVHAREKSPITTTLQLAEIVKRAIPARDRRHGSHPARKTFQALRIEVNRELEVLEKGLEAAIRWAAPHGRICVISYHSLEDRIVKHVFSTMSQGCTCPADLPVCVCGNVPIVKVKTKHPIVPSEKEIAHNPRSRSAKMRYAIKLDTSLKDTHSAS